MVSHNMMIKGDTYLQLKELKMKMSQEKGRKVSFTEVIDELLDNYEYNPYEDDTPMTYEEAHQRSLNR